MTKRTQCPKRSGKPLEALREIEAMANDATKTARTGVAIVILCGLGFVGISLYLVVAIVRGEAGI